MSDSLIERLRGKLIREIEQERAHLRDIGGPTGMRNSQASALGLQRNMIREEILEFISEAPIVSQ